MRTELNSSPSRWTQVPSGIPRRRLRDFGEFSFLFFMPLWPGPPVKGVAMPARGRTRQAALRPLWLLLGPSALLAGLAGCGSGVNVVPLSHAEKDLSYIAIAYREAHSRLGRPPKDAEDLKPFLKDFGDPEKLLVSPNDNQPYVVVWGADPSRGGPTPYQGMWAILAYERKGTGGKRAVTDIRGRPLTVPE